MGEASSYDRRNMTDGPFEYDRHDDNDEPYPIEYDQFFCGCQYVCRCQ